MTTSRQNPDVDEYISQATKWQAEVEALRKILLSCQLDEALKWNKPCYTYEGKNIVIIARLKEHCALGFLKGSLLSDGHNVLVRPGEHSQAMRWLKFKDLRGIADLEPVIKAYVAEAIEAERAGLKVEFKENMEPTMPQEFQDRLAEDPSLKAAFEALTPGRQRGYILYFAAPKLSKTREARVEKHIDLIMDGLGLRDEYSQRKK